MSTTTSLHPLPTVIFGAHQEIRLPVAVARRLKLRKGAKLEILPLDGAIVVAPAGRIPNSQRYFWTSEWQAKEREADADIVAGRLYGPFNTAKDTIASLRGRKL